MFIVQSKTMSIEHFKQNFSHNWLENYGIVKIAERCFSKVTNI
jgi:hypothetical protein